MTDKYFFFYVPAFFISMLITVFTEKKLIPLLKEKAKQPIYAEGPAWHMKKSGTPTMGGLAFLLATLLTCIPAAFFFFAKGLTEEAASLSILLFYAALNAGIGIFDDLRKLKRKHNEGLRPRQKLLLQSIAATVFLFCGTCFLETERQFSFPSGGWRLEFSIIRWLCSRFSAV
jgi:phospho-N-acetylmuramoyl-pentapeptide-transferase